MESIEGFLEAFGERKTAFEWSKDRRSVVSHLTLVGRLEGGWPLERALTTPLIKNIRQLEKTLTAFGESKTLLDWAMDPRAKVPSRTILWRVRRGWSTEDAISQEPTPSAVPVRKSTRQPPRLYEAFGVKNTIRGWLEDSRCTVKREKLLRNLAQGLSMEEALTSQGEDGRRKRGRPIVDRPIESFGETLSVLAHGAELWHAQTPGGTRSSLLKGNTRYDIEPEFVTQLIDSGYVELVFDTPTIAEYRVSRLGKQAAEAEDRQNGQLIAG